MAKKKIIHMCTDVALPDELLAEANLVALEENPANAAPPDPSKPLEIAVVKAKLWSPGRTLRIRFLDGDLVVQQKVAQVAQKWTQVANLHFDFGNHPQAEIRISFKGPGSWSQIGTDALVITDQRQPTINLGWLTAKSLDQEYNRVVLHEFGHALGAIHEHNSPASGIPWNEPVVIAYYKQTNGWDEAKTRLNVLSKYNASETNFTEFDPNSIMLYPVPIELTLNGYTIPWSNAQLSPKDKAFMTQMYPKS